MAPYSDSKNKRFVVANRCGNLRYFYKAMSELAGKGGVNSRQLALMVAANGTVVGRVFLLAQSFEYHV